jgi:MFS family permease
MTATPISMHEMSGHSIEQTTFVIQSHIVAMFLPSLLSGYLVKKGMRLSLIIAGLVIYLGVAIIGISGVSVPHYWFALVALGLGWNLLFVTSTALLPGAYNDQEKFHAQALNDFLIFTTQAIAAFGAGWLVFSIGWISVLWIAAIASALWLLAIIFLRRTPTA